MTVTSKDVLVIGGANWDHLLLADRLPEDGETRRGSRYLQAPGGKGANQAMAAARLGASTALVGRIGDDAGGRACRRALRGAGVDLAGLLTSAGEATGTALVHVGGDGEKRILAVPGANGLVTVADVLAGCARFRPPAVSLLSFECGAAVAGAAIAHLRSQGSLVILDPSPAEGISDEALRQVAVIKPDAEEAHALTGVRVSDRSTAATAARKLLERGVGAAVAQAGAGGDLLVDHDHELWLPRLTVDAVDATGAGDAFVATIAAYLAAGSDLRAAARAGSAAAALATRALGAQASLASREEISQLLDATS